MNSIIETPYEALKVGEIVRKNPLAASVFSDLGIDFCCGGNVLFTEACQNKNADPAAVWQVVEQSKGNEATSRTLNFDEFELDFLSDYLVNVHHHYLYKNLPEIRFFVDKVVNKHAERFAYLEELCQLYNVLERDLVGHLPKEENILFPYIKQMLSEMKQQTEATQPFFGTIRNPLSVMHAEHDEAGEILHRLRTITNNYTPPENACNSHLVMLAKLKELDQDLVQHIHLENNILFPKVVILEEEYFKNS
ncbi:MAG: iron-sulfur cluster repair di-iron protein [Saprospiraceae bacterium]|nr:iron-sulfur cluster repair di-iron protein [Saprospiraceae bacterium]